MGRAVTTRRAGERRAAARWAAAPWAGALALALWAHGASAATHIVRPDGTGDFSTIQQAIAASDEGDTVSLANGTFRGDGNRDLDFLGKAITVASESIDPSQCIIDCDGSIDAPHNGFTFRSGEGPASLLQWIKIVNGFAVRGGGVSCIDASPTIRGLVLHNDSAEDGGGISCERSSPSIEFCIFIENFVVNDGGGILCGVDFGDGSSPSIRNSTFSGNDARAGGGIHCRYSIPSIVGCTFLENTAETGGGLSCYFANPAIDICLFQANEAAFGGAVSCENSSGAVLTSCTLVKNRGVDRGGGVYSRDSIPIIQRTIIAWSTAGQAVYSPEGGMIPELSCCDLYRNSGGDWVGAVGGQRDTNGNIGVDPLFCSRLLDNFTLGMASLCAPPQSGSCGQIGAFGVGCTEVPIARTTWGSIKSSFR